jgi:hypothetical protein
MRVEIWKEIKVLCIRIHLLKRQQNEWITKVELCELQSDLVEYWVLYVWLWVDCSLSVSISIACAALLVDATPGSLATPDVSALRRSRNFLIRSADVVLGSIRSSPFPLLLAHLALVFGLHCSICVFLSIFNLLLLITFELQTLIYLCSSHFTKLSKLYTYV